MAIFAMAYHVNEIVAAVNPTDAAAAQPVFLPLLLLLLFCWSPLVLWSLLLYDMKGSPPLSLSILSPSLVLWSLLLHG